MLSLFVREQRRYSRVHLLKLIGPSRSEGVDILRKLVELGVLKLVKGMSSIGPENQFAFQDALVEDGQIDLIGASYVFNFVGVVVIDEITFISYPKYIRSNARPVAEMRTVLRVLERRSSDKHAIQIADQYTIGGESNRLGVILFLLHDYFEHGVYQSQRTEISLDPAAGEILWDKTVNETLPVLNAGRPVYPILFTRRRLNDHQNFFRRLHEITLTYASRGLMEAGLLELFNLPAVDLSYDSFETLGDKEYVLDQLRSEIDIEYGTRRKLLLQAIYSYLEHGSGQGGASGPWVYGTSAFEHVWEDVCSAVLGDQLHSPISSLPLPGGVTENFSGYPSLASVIAHPVWNGVDEDGSFTKLAKGTLIPDTVCVRTFDGNSVFFIFDAKYYFLRLQRDLKLSGQPGVADVSKQYLYQLAFRDFISEHDIQHVRNCFLMPAEGSDVIKSGTASFELLSALELRDIDIRLLPADEIYKIYLNGGLLDLEKLEL